MNNKNYHWCPQHKAWTLHTAEKCHLVAKASATPTTTGGNEGGNLTFSQALVGMLKDETTALDKEEDS
jgi:hypothetical protein